MTYIIHIGYPKTGTTWLQKELFPKVKNYTVLIKPEITRVLVKKTMEYKKWKTTFTNLSNENLIISDEDLVTKKVEHITPQEKAKRLYEIFPQAHIVIFIREQKNIIESAYSQYVKSGGTLKFKEYLTLLKSTRKIYYWNYLRIINFYASLFGKKRIHIFLYESLKNEPDFVRKFSQIFNFILSSKPNIKKHRNLALTPFVLNIWCFLNQFTKRRLYSNFLYKKYYFHVPALFSLSKYFCLFLNFVIKKVFKNPGRLKIPEKTGELLDKVFEESNLQLKEKYKVNQILKYNYAVKK